MNISVISNIEGFHRESTYKYRNVPCHCIPFWNYSISWDFRGENHTVYSYTDRQVDVTCAQKLIRFKPSTITCVYRR